MRETMDVPPEVQELNRFNLNVAEKVVDEVACFPIEVFPPILSNIISEASQSIGVQPDLIAVPMLVIAGASIGSGLEIEIKPSWREGANIYGAIVSPPGDRKSPAVNLAAAPVFAKQREFSDRYKTEMESYLKDMAAFRVRFSSWKARYKKALKDSEQFSEEQPAEPRKPTLLRTYSTDSTTEALAEILSGTPEGILLIKDELSGWVRSMDQYRSGKGADLQFYLSAWNRAPIIVDRKNAPEPKCIYKPFISVIGGIPPDVLEELIGEKGHEDGFMHRILFCCPDGFVPNDELLMKSFPDELAGVWVDIYMRLRDLPLKGVSPNPNVIKLTGDAQALWIQFLKHHHNELKNPDFPPYLRGPWAKMEGYCARFALIIHQIRFITGFTDSKDVDGDSLISARKLVDYFKTHTKRVYRKLHITVADRRAQHLLDWIRRHGGQCTSGDLIAYGVCNLQKASEAGKALSDLIDRGYGKFIEAKSSRGPSRKLFVLYETEPSNPAS